jgi:hypothetical protein
MSEAAEQYPLSTSPPVTDTMSMYPGFNPFPWNDPVQTMGPGSASVPDSGPLVSGGLGPIDPIENVSTPLSHPVPPIQWPEDINIANWFPHATPDEREYLTAHTYVS